MYHFLEKEKKKEKWKENKKSNFISNVRDVIGLQFGSVASYLPVLKLLFFFFIYFI